MSMFSMASSSVAAGLGHGLLEGIEVHDHQVDGFDVVLLHLFHMLGVAAAPRRPPCTLGWSVFTRPSSISGKPVNSDTSFTGHRRPAGAWLCRLWTDLDVQLIERLGEVQDTFLVRNTDERARHFGHD